MKGITYKSHVNDLSGQSMARRVANGPDATLRNGHNRIFAKLWSQCQTFNPT